MSVPAIVVESVSKRYELSLRHDTLRGRLAHLLSRTRSAPAENPGEFWALREVSLQVPAGEVMGVVGRNGAGKSTLLKILSRITEPSTGRVRIRGRVASLLEVGTGFHPELSGRDNIFLNGAILGMSRAEIRRKFDEIVAFAEVERFIDTPVKRYSSGMYVRLAFAVAAHLEPEILIVDEVLAVGDAAFQRKCLGKMQDVAHTAGRTVLFVSHHLASVRQLCRTAVMLEAGRVVAQGPCHKVLDTYQQSVARPVAPAAARAGDRSAAARTASVQVETVDGQPAAAMPLGVPWQVRVVLEIARPCSRLVVGLGLKSSDGTPVQTAWHPPVDLAPGRYEVRFVQDRVILELGSYSVLVGLTVDDRTVEQIEAAHVEITAGPPAGYFPATAGVGAVLNSMHTSLQRLA